MKIALPSENGTLFGHFGGAPHFDVFTLDTNQKMVHHEVLNPPPHEHGAFPKWLKSIDVKVVIASGIGQGAIQLFQEYSIQVIAGAQIKKTEELIKDYVGNTLTLMETECNHDHHQCH
jgi:predicted Fe-Mo cluster-binding NifX family protein